MFREHRDDCMHRYLKLAIATMEIFRLLLQKRIYPLVSSKDIPT
jgi:hypothetical protein